MKEPSTLFRYRPDSTIIHRLPAAVKLLVMALATVAVFAVKPVELAALCVILVILSFIARIPFLVFLNNIRLLLWYALLIGAFRCIGKPLEAAILIPEIWATGLYLWQLSAVLFAGTLFYETTSTLEIRETLATAQKRLERLCRCPPDRLPDLGFLLSLTITFIPRIFDAWSALNRTWDARGGKLQKGPLGAWRRMTVLIPSLIERLLSIAADTDRAIRNRSR